MPTSDAELQENLVGLLRSNLEERARAELELEKVLPGEDWHEILQVQLRVTRAMSAQSALVEAVIAPAYQEILGRIRAEEV